MIDRVAGHYGQIGVVEKVEASQCSIRMPDGKLILRSTYIERVNSDSAWPCGLLVAFILGWIVLAAVQFYLHGCFSCR